jgi:hypothetical protein
MKGRESGVPEEVFRQSFYDADCIVEKLKCAKENRGSIAEFGSGYGTFTFPLAKRGRAGAVQDAPTGTISAALPRLPRSKRRAIG